MKKFVLMLLCWCALSAVTFAAGRVYRTGIWDDNIRTLQILPVGEQLNQPVVELGSTELLVISFDELSYEAGNFYYKIRHCNADWSESGLAAMEYLNGFDGGMIKDYSYSVNTTINYIHYELTLPNEDVSPAVSGNYAVEIARDNDFENGVVATACFSVVEPYAEIWADVSGISLKELNGRYQQLEVEINVDQIRPAMAMQEFVLVVRQNGRRDSERMIMRPTYMNGYRIQYKNTDALAFEAGNQYRSIDFSSRYTYGSGIDHIEFVGEEYHVVLEPAYERKNKRESYDIDAHGAYVVNLQGSDYSDTEADYMWVHFYYPSEFPYLEGRMYLLGDLTFNSADFGSEMVYDIECKCYSRSLLLKQGGYNYVYALKPKGREELTLLPTEGGFWQSRNRYDIFLYYRPFGARYDRLVGWSVLEK